MRGDGARAAADPPVGRDATVAVLENAVADGAAVVLSGPMGVGKTTMVRWVADRLVHEGRPLLWLQGTPGTRELPFGTAVPVLSRSGGTSLSPGDVGEWLAESLSVDSVCVLDDLHWIDDQTLGVVQQMLASSSPPAALATVREGEPVSEAGTQLLRLAGLREVPVGDLDAAATEDLAVRLLGGPPDGALLQEVIRAGQGNPLFVTELLAASRADGTIVAEHGLWCLRGSLSPSLVLSEVVAGRFDGLDPSTLRAAELLAVAEELEMGVAEDVCGIDELADLDRKGMLAEVGVGAAELVGLAHPVYGEVLRRRMGRLTTRSHRRALAAAIGRQWAAQQTERRDIDALRVARWAMEAGERIAPDLALAAARAAHASSDLPMAETLARQAWNDTASVEAGNLLAEVLHGSSRFDEARALVQAVATTTSGDRERATVVALDAVSRFHGERDIDGALTLAIEARAELRDEAARRALHVTEIYLLLMSERFGALDGAIADLENECPAYTTPAMRQLVAGAHIIRGRTDTVLGLLDAEVIDDEDLFVRSEDLGAMADGLRALSLTRAGRVIEAERIARAAHPRCLELRAPRARAAASYGLAMALLLQGRAGEAGRWAADAVVAQEGVLAPNGLLMAHALGLEAAIAVGDADRIRSERAALAALTDTHERLYAAIGCRAEATARALIDDEREAGITMLCEAAERYEAGGAPDYALDLAFRAVVLGADPDRLVELTGRAGSSSPPLGALRARAVAALAVDDPDELEVVGDALAELGCVVDARHVLTAAGRAAARRGATRRATELRHRVEHLTRATVALDEPPADREAIPPGRWALLTAREDEVCRLAARGLTSRAIAERLHLSRRTVDHALQRAYPKLGIAGRVELVGRELPEPEPRATDPNR